MIVCEFNLEIMKFTQLANALAEGCTVAQEIIYKFCSSIG